MYNILETKSINFNSALNKKKTISNIEDKLKRSLKTCYNECCFSTFPYLLFNYNSYQCSNIMNSGNCIAMIYF